MGYEYASKKDDPVVKPDYIDGKYMKYCECGCGTYFEVQPRARGQQRYTKACYNKMRQYIKAKDPKSVKTCRVCGQLKPLELFIKSGLGKNRRSRTCKDCFPFTHNDDVLNMPDCGNYDEDKYQDFGHVATCPLYAECAERLANGVWVPCELPDRRELVSIIFSEPEERARIKDLVKNGLTKSGVVFPDSVDNYLEYYREIGEAIEAEETETLDTIQLPKVVVSSYANM